MGLFSFFKAKQSYIDHSFKSSVCSQDNSCTIHTTHINPWPASAARPINMQANGRAWPEAPQAIGHRAGPKSYPTPAATSVDGHEGARSRPQTGERSGGDRGFPTTPAPETIDRGACARSWPQVPRVGKYRGDGTNHAAQVTRTVNGRAKARSSWPPQGWEWRSGGAAGQWVEGRDGMGHRSLGERKL